MITLKVRIPAPSSGLLANLLGVIALLGIAVAVGGLTHNVWWAVLVASVEAFGLAAVWSLNPEGTEETAGTALTRVA